ncbi:MAG TPA: hypothetical protein VHT91_47630 [Kofleriaceae bacterium]|jgi:hypothetical protein|nr:hypothetical protein [Kofleriaceae bacterium]
MDPVLTDAARALAIGDPLTALKRVALRDDPPALALRGIAMAQLGDLARGRELLERAARGFGPRDAVARARCAIARSEIALATRDLGADRRDRALDAAIAVLDAHGDRRNALHGRLIALCRLLLLGRVEIAARARDALALDLARDGAPPALVAIAELAAAEIATRRIEPAAARAALGRARDAAQRARIPALAAEVAAAARALDAPAARLIASGEARPLALAEVAAVLAAPGVIVDACRRTVRDGARGVALARRPVLFALARALGEAWPHDATREALIAAAFEVRRANDSHRARLRVELGRLRRELREIAEIRATPGGFALAPRRTPRVAVLIPPIDGHGAALLALLGDGEAWSTSALALALGHSQRTVQRALSELEARARVWSRGGARARRWLAPPSHGFTTALLLPAALPIG